MMQDFIVFALSNTEEVPERELPDNRFLRFNQAVFNVLPSNSLDIVATISVVARLQVQYFGTMQGVQNSDVSVSL